MLNAESRSESRETGFIVITIADDSIETATWEKDRDEIFFFLFFQSKKQCSRM